MIQNDPHYDEYTLRNIRQQPLEMYVFYRGLSQRLRAKRDVALSANDSQRAAVIWAEINESDRLGDLAMYYAYQSNPQLQLDEPKKEIKESWQDQRKIRRANRDRPITEKPVSTNYASLAAVCLLSYGIWQVSKKLLRMMS